MPPRSVYPLLVLLALALPCGAECPGFGAAETLGSPALQTLTEISGIAASRSTPGVFWVHNDSGGEAAVYALQQDGAHLGVYHLTGAQAVDYEDIALGPGPEAGKDYIYVGDIGDNEQKRASITVYRVQEPETALGQSPADTQLGGVEAFELRYPGAPGAVFDAEALLVDPLDGTLLIATKGRGGDDGTSRIFAGPNPLLPDAPNLLAEMGTFATGPGRFNRITGGDADPRGTEAVLRTNIAIYHFTRDAAQPLASAFSASPCMVTPAAEPQGEAICFGPLGDALYTISESGNKAKALHPLHRYPRAAPQEEGESPARAHTGDRDADGRIVLSELLRVLQFFNMGALHCASDSEDGYAPGAGQAACDAHDSDYDPEDWAVELPELLRFVQFYNAGGLRYCGEGRELAEDEFCVDSPRITKI